MDGVVVVDKDMGISSTTVVNRVKSALQTKKAGHTGTLDPFATGVLPVCLGVATRVIPYLQEGTKEYEATLVLGTATDTLDNTGTVISRCDVPDLTTGHISEVMARFSGETEQVPPMYSAIKKDGVRMYELARKGVEVPREPRKVVIDELRLLDHTPAQAHELKFFVRCTRGTYVRTLGADIARELGTCGHLTGLRRLSSGGFRIEDSSKLENIRHGDFRLLSIREVLKDYKELVADATLARHIRHGRQLFRKTLAAYDLPVFESGEMLVVLSSDAVVAIVEALVPSRGLDTCDGDDIVFRLVRVLHS